MKEIFSLEAEKSLLGSLLINNDALLKIMDILSPDDFYNVKHREIFKTYLEMFVTGEKIDLITLSGKLENKKTLKEIGGRTYLVELANTETTSAHIVDYALIVKDKSLRRQVIDAQNTNSHEIFDESIEINTLLAGVQNRIFQISPLKTRNNSVQSILGDIKVIQDEYAEKYKQGKRIIGISCGISKIDEFIDGLRPGHLWLIGSWHGYGKTSFGLNIVHNVLEQGIACSIVSCEMSQTDITAKIMGIRHQLSSMKILKGIQDSATADKIKEANIFLNQTSLDIHTEFDFEKIKMQIRKDVYIRKVKLVLIDYAQKMTSADIYDEVSLTSKIGKELSNLAQELKITIILLSQISNEAQKGGGAGGGYKGSGALEASADLAIRLVRDKKSEIPEAEWVEMKLWITKNKFGFDGIIPTMFHLKSGQVVYNNNSIQQLAVDFGGEVVN
jgi:replicative DNA helicase